ncbi:Hypothetical predicted protein [Pelobates cultripes]|uniref:Uncharacterized protein n=1 Tax=Pelobates cultripes TaxID=61616 RepID=A0AAD1WCJ9_PELCU|nr:Hypothetical predicted protein [Pelobates cultripes]
MSTLQNHSAKKAILLTQHSFHARGNINGKLLTRALQQRLHKSYLSKVTDTQGNTHQLTADIAKAFQQYYASLYGLKLTGVSTTKRQQCVHNNIIYRLTPTMSNTLNAPFTAQELSTAKPPQMVKVQAQTYTPINTTKFFILN